MIAPAELTDAQVWQAFRSLPLEGEDLFAGLRRELAQSVFSDGEGDTLEVGAGDGFLWCGDGQALLDLALSRGSLVLTDSEPSCVEECRANLPSRPGLFIEGADVTQLPYVAARFPRVLAVHVLHWCATPDAIRTAVAEIARVTHSEGRAVVVTVDETVHMAEIYALMRDARARLAARGTQLEVEIPSCPPRIARFCASNAETYLRASFGEVRRVDFAYAHRVERTHPLIRISGEELVIRYLRAAPFLCNATVDSRLLEAFFDEARRLVSDAIGEFGAFRTSRRDVLYDCAAPRWQGSYVTKRRQIGPT